MCFIEAIASFCFAEIRRDKLYAPEQNSPVRQWFEHVRALNFAGIGRHATSKETVRKRMTDLEIDLPLIPLKRIKNEIPGI